MYNPLPSTRRNACTRFRTRPPKIYEKILSFFEISFRSFSRRKFRRLFFLSGSDVYIINSGREMIFESRSLSRGKLPRDSLNSIPFHCRSFRDSTARNIFYLFARRKGNFSFFRNWKIVTLILFDISDISERYTRLAKERKSSFVTRAFRFLSIPPFELLSIFSHFFPAIERRYVRIVFADDNNGQTWLAWHDICSRGGFLFICAQLIRTNPRPTVWFTGLAVSEHCSKRVEAFRFAMRVGTSSRYALFD